MSKLYEPTYAHPQGAIIKPGAGVGITLAYGSGAPTGSTLGYRKGCQYVDYANGVVYINTGSVASSTWVLAATSASALLGIGYTTGAGGAVTQATNKATPVTLNKPCGQITMNGSALGAGAEAPFTLTNSLIAATDVVVVSIASGGTAGSYLVSVTATAAGSCEITVSNVSAGSLSEAIVLNFAVIKAVAA